MRPFFFRRTMTTQEHSLEGVRYLNAIISSHNQRTVESTLVRNNSSSHCSHIQPNPSCSCLGSPCKLGYYTDWECAKNCIKNVHKELGLRLSRPGSNPNAHSWKQKIVQCVLRKIIHGLLRSPTNVFIPQPNRHYLQTEVVLGTNDDWYIMGIGVGKWLMLYLMIPLQNILTTDCLYIR